jgi:hypothetical protein
MKFAAVLLSWFLACSALFAIESPQKQRVQLYGEVDVVNSACGAAGVTLSSKQFPCRVMKVRMGSPAAYAGLLQNDKVLKASIEGNKLNILFERGGMRYGVKLNTARDPIVVQKTQLEDAGVINVSMDKATAVKLISKYNILFIVDQSGSMGDLLQQDKDGRTKWDWCNDAMSDFSKDMGTLLETGQLMLIMFDDKFETFPNCTPTQVQEMFRKFAPRGGTIMGPPLEVGLQEHFRHSSKPMLIIILTDGCPGDPRAVEKAIVAATNKMNGPQELKIRFLEIGDQYQGSSLLDLLDTRLVTAGARYDVVDYASFDEVKKLGLARAMVCEVSPKKIRSNADSMEAQMDALERQIRELNAKK